MQTQSEEIVKIQSQLTLLSQQVEQLLKEKRTLERETSQATLEQEQAAPTFASTYALSQRQAESLEREVVSDALHLVRQKLPKEEDVPEKLPDFGPTTGLSQEGRREASTLAEIFKDAVTAIRLGHATDLSPENLRAAIVAIGKHICQLCLDKKGALLAESTLPGPLSRAFRMLTVHPELSERTVSLLQTAATLAPTLGRTNYRPSFGHGSNSFRQQFRRRGRFDSMDRFNKTPFKKPSEAGADGA